MRLFWKVFSRLLFSVALIILFLSYGIVIRQLSAVERHYIEMNRFRARFISDAIEEGYPESRWPFALLRRLSMDEDSLFWWIVSDDGVIFLADDAAFTRTRARDYFPMAKNVDKNEFVYLDKDNDVGVVITRLNMGAGTWHFWSGFSLNHVRTARQEAIYSIAVLFILTTAAIGIVLYTTIRWFLVPIDELTRTIYRVGQGDLEHRIMVHSDDELGQLADSFNRMIERMRTTTVSKEFVDSIITSMSDALIVVDRENRIVSVNSAAQQLLDYMEDELIGRPVRTILPIEELPLTGNGGKGPIDGCRMRSQETVLKAKDGSTIPVLFSSASISDIDGTVRHRVVTVKDITERKKTERALQESEERFRKIFEDSSIGMAMADLDFRILKVNSTLCRMFGYCEKELTRMTFLDLIHPDDVQVDEEEASEISQGERSFFRAEKRHIKKNKDVLWVALTVSPIRDESGRITHTVAMFEDITDQKRAKDKVQSINEELENRVRERTSELESANEQLELLMKQALQTQKIESLGILAGGIAHDFNNLLTGILGNISLATAHVRKKSKTRDWLKQAEKSSLQAKDLVQRLLTFSKGGSPIKSNIDIGAVIRDAASIALSGSNVGCELDIPDFLPPVLADRGQVSQVFSNIILNAAQAMTEGGTVTVRTELVTVGDSGSIPVRKGQYVQVSIEDRGRGMAEAHVHKVFDPFFTTKPEGTGLGLAVAYSIVKKHEGNITVDSTSGVGTTVRVSLPTSSENHEDETSKETASNGELDRLDKDRVLVMDDDEIIRELLDEVLTSAGCDVVHARDGKEAIERYKKAMDEGKPFGVVIMDLTIPGGMGGEEAIKIMLEIDPSVKAIVSSGYSNDPIMSNYREYGFSGVITKPYRVRELIETVREVIA